MDKVNKWKEELDLLIEIISKAGLTGTIKWGTDVFTHKEKNVVGVAGFKEFFALWFYNGVFLKDEQGVLVFFMILYTVFLMKSLTRIVIRTLMATIVRKAMPSAMPSDNSSRKLKCSPIEVSMSMYF